MAMFGRATRNDVLRSYTPTMAERIPIAVQGFLGRLGLNKYQARSFGQPIADVLGYSPVGAVAQSWDAGQAAARAPGMFGKAAGLGGGMALAALGAVPGGKALRGAERIFYRGTNGSAERIAGGIGEGLLFASPQERIAKLYGDNIEKIAAKPEAKILRESSRDFARLIGRKTGGLYSAMRPGESVHSLSNDAIAKAREAGYDAVDFDKTTDVGTAIINEAAFIRNHGKPPLAMDEASRMARAEAMGFDTSQMYLHGTTKDFGKFQPSRDGTYGGGIYLTKDPITADAYSTNGKRFYDNAEPDAGSQVMPVFIRPGSDEAAGSTRNIKVKDARDIRSKFAAFDPAKRGSANLLAGLGVGAMVAPSMFGNRGGER